MSDDLSGLVVELRGTASPVARGVLSELEAAGAQIGNGAATRLPDILLVSYPLLPDDELPGPELFESTRHTGDAMARRGSGRILFLLSALAGLPARRHLEHSLAMATAMAGMRTLAMSLGPAVLVNAVGAGVIEEDGTIVAGDPAMLGHAAVGRAGTIHEVAAAALFFCDPLNSYTTGQLLVADGGWMAGYGRNF